MLDWNDDQSEVKRRAFCEHHSRGNDTRKTPTMTLECLLLLDSQSKGRKKSLAHDSDTLCLSLCIIAVIMCCFFITQCASSLEWELRRRIYSVVYHRQSNPPLLFLHALQQTAGRENGLVFTLVSASLCSICPPIHFLHSLPSSEWQSWRRWHAERLPKQQSLIWDGLVLEQLFPDMPSSSWRPYFSFIESSVDLVFLHNTQSVHHHFAEMNPSSLQEWSLLAMNHQPL